MSKSPVEYLKHIRDECDYLIQNSKDMSKKEFMQNDTLKRAFVRSLEIIGEAVRNLPYEFRKKQRETDWKSIVGMRDRLIHHYFGVDYDIVWDVIKNETPTLKKRITAILEKKNSISKL